MLYSRKKNFKKSQNAERFETIESFSGDGHLLNKVKINLMIGPKEHETTDGILMVLYPEMPVGRAFPN